MIVTTCNFLKSIKSVIISVPCNTSPSENYVAHSCLCNRLTLRKNWFVCARWMSVHIKSVVEQEFFHEFAFDNKALKTFVEF